MPGFGVDRLKGLLEVTELMTVCNDFASVMASINHGRPLRQEAPRSAALADINRIVNTLLGVTEGSPSRPGIPKEEPKGSLSKFISRFGIKTR
jgi:Flp pilus assembly CpaE family ATPase